MTEQVSSWKPGDVLQNVEPWVTSKRFRLIRLLDAQPRTSIYNPSEELWDAVDPSTGESCGGWFELERWKLQ